LVEFPPTQAVAHLASGGGCKYAVAPLSTPERKCSGGPE
jgi:hypothetical protein